MTGQGPGTASPAVAGALPVAVVIPLHGSSVHIATTLRSVLAQRPGVAEVVLVDDGSTPEVLALARSIPGVRVVTNAGRGVDAARRCGVSSTTAPYLALLDHDDVWHPDHVAELVAVLEARPDASAALCEPVHFQDGQVPTFDGCGNGTEEVDPWEAYPDSFTTTPSGMLVRRSALDAIGGWTDDVFEGCGELYVWLRLTEWGPILRNGRTTAGYRVHEASASAIMRREAKGRYADQIAAAAEAAARRRAERLPEKAEALEKRATVAQALRHLGAGVFAGDPREVALGAELLEAGTDGEPAERIVTVMRLLFWLLDGGGDAAGVESDAYRPLIAYWPLRARRTARHRLRYLALRPLLATALRRPTAAWRWRWLVEALAVRIVGRR